MRKHEHFRFFTNNDYRLVGINGDYFNESMKLKASCPAYQLSLFEYQRPPVIPNFNGDFVKQMNFISNLPKADWKRLFEVSENLGKNN